MRPMRAELLHGDCVELMRAMPECSVDSIVTDPPYELSFMGKTWDGAGIAYSLDMWREALRVLKPGGHLLAFGGTRTYHRMACAIEDAGFEIRDSIHWVYGSGFPKSLNVAKSIEGKLTTGSAQKNGFHRLAGEETGGGSIGMYDTVEEQGFRKRQPTQHGARTLDATTEEARRWEGWGTALKPAHEPIVVARKPLSGTVAGNVLVWGTGGLNIDGCRVGTTVETWPASRNYSAREMSRPGSTASDDAHTQPTGPAPSGRWPANIVLDGAAAAALDQQSGVSKSQGGRIGKKEHGAVAIGGAGTYEAGDPGFGDVGGASRFFTQADFGPDDWPFVYQAKPSKRERNAGLDGLPERPASERYETISTLNAEHQQRLPAANHHPTVKPVALMRHLVRLVTPPGGTVLDPFAGSGTTLVAAVLEGINAIGCEMTDEYLPIIEGRLAWAEEQVSVREELAKAPPQQPTLL
jgi:DNA modification methylase